MVQSQKYTSQATSIDLSKPETQNNHLETRLIQLNHAISMELWQEAYKAVEDIYGLMNLSKTKPKPGQYRKNKSLRHENVTRFLRWLWPYVRCVSQNPTFCLKGKPVLRIIIFISLPVLVACQKVIIIMKRGSFENP
jgi:hypothetical protein